jgi:hypothetical protein
MIKKQPTRARIPNVIPNQKNNLFFGYFLYLSFGDDTRFKLEVVILHDAHGAGADPTGSGAGIRFSRPSTLSTHINITTSPPSISSAPGMNFTEPKNTPVIINRTISPARAYSTTPQGFISM